jgi:hypothetical protein
VFAKTNQCKLIFTVSPVYKDAEIEVLNKREIMRGFNDIALINNVPFLDLSSDTVIANNKMYFEDNYHMMYEGAKLYTQKLARFYNNIK